MTHGQFLKNPICVYRESEKEKGKERKNREKTKLFFIFSSKKINSRKNVLTRQKKYKKIKKMPWHQGDRAGVPCHPGARVPI
jgi:hypothetical protein